MGEVKWGTAIKLQKGLRIVQRHTRGGEIVWYSETRVGGKRVFVSLETSDAKTAREKAIAGPEVLAPRPFSVSPKSVTQTGLTLEKVLDEYDKWFRQKRKASGAAVTLPAVEKFVDFVGAENETRSVTREHVQKFVDKHEGRSPIYVRNQFARVRAFLRWIDAKHDGAVNLAAVKGIELPQDDSIAAPMPPLETVRALLKRLGSHSWLGDYCTALFEIGCRPGELLAVRGVDLRDDLLDIRRRADWSPKNKHSERTLKLSPEAAAILKARVETMFDKKFPIFGTATGKVRDAKDVGKQYREAMKVDDKIPAELEDFNLYAFRHAFASFHARTKVDGKPNPVFLTLQELGRYMGHSPSSTITLQKWYIDREAEELGAPGSLVGETKDGKVIELRQKKS